MLHIIHTSKISHLPTRTRHSETASLQRGYCCARRSAVLLRGGSDAGVCPLPQPPLLAEQTVGLPLATPNCCRRSRTRPLRRARNTQQLLSPRRLVFVAPWQRICVVSVQGVAAHLRGYNYMFPELENADIQHFVKTSHFYIIYFCSDYDQYTIGL